MVRVPFDLGDGTALHAGQKTATHAAVRAIGFYPLLDVFALDSWHRYTDQRKLMRLTSAGLTRRRCAPDRRSQQVPPFGGRWRYRERNRLKPVYFSMMNSSSALTCVCASSLRFSISEICRRIGPLFEESDQLTPYPFVERVINHLQSVPRP